MSVSKGDEMTEELTIREQILNAIRKAIKESGKSVLEISKGSKACYAGIKAIAEGKDEHVRAITIHRLIKYFAIDEEYI